MNTLLRLVSVVVLFGGCLLFAAADVEGDFNIRFEPWAVLQTQVQVPFHIHITDSLHNPLQQAKVTLQIETKDHANVKVYNASAIDPGVYAAKPVFPSGGDWIITVEVHWAGKMSVRAITFNVPR